MPKCRCPPCTAGLNAQALRVSSALRHASAAGGRTARATQREPGARLDCNLMVRASAPPEALQEDWQRCADAAGMHAELSPLLAGPPPHRRRRSRRRRRPLCFNSPLQQHRQQRELAARVVTCDDAPWLQPGAPDSLQLVGGLDVSFAPAVSSGAGAGAPAAAPTTAPAVEAVAALAVLSWPALQLRHLELLPLGPPALPYLPGFLGFRCGCFERGKRCVVPRCASCPHQSGRQRQPCCQAHHPSIPPCREVPAFQELLRRAAARGVHPQARPGRVSPPAAAPAGACGAAPALAHPSPAHQGCPLPSPPHHSCCWLTAWACCTRAAAAAPATWACSLGCPQARARAPLFLRDGPPPPPAP